MGFFSFDHKAVNEDLKGVSTDFLHRHGCAVCPLKAEHAMLRHPDMKPYGTKKPVIYMLGESPGADEDKLGRPFVGKAGRVLRMRIPERWDDRLRWNNVVRTRPPGNRNPTAVEVECCRPSVSADIEQTQPEAIFGFGNIPLEWVMGQQGITKWSGLRFPVKIGSHTCWFYPMIHPSYIARTRRFDPRSAKEYGSDIEFQFAKDLERAFKEVDAGLPEPVVHTVDDAMEDVEWVTGKKGDLERVVDYLRSIYDDPLVGFDYECNGPRPYRAGMKIMSVGLSSEEHGSLSFPLYHPEAQWDEADLTIIEEELEEFFYKAKCRKVVHSLSFEQEWTAFFYGRKSLRAGKWGCSMSQAFILGNRQGLLGLEDLTQQYFGINIKKLSSVNRKKIADEPLKKVLPYNAMDAKYHRLVYEKQTERLKRNKLSEVYREHLRRVTATTLTQMKGVPIDQKKVKTFDEGYREVLADIEDEMADLEVVKKFKRQTGSSFRPSANDDVKLILTKYLGKKLTVEELEQLKTDKVALRGFKHEFVDLLLEWRANNKLYSTYVKPLLPTSIDVYENGTALHPILHTTRTRTWRTSSDSPNTQNFPKREHKEVRKQVAPGGDLRVVSFDYAGIQARNVAMESKDSTLIKYFWNRYDIHTDWLNRIEKLVPKWKHSSKEHSVKRNIAKNGLVFPSFFGARPKKVATVCEFDIEVADELLNDFWSEFPEVKGWHERVEADFFKTGYVTGLSGFRRYAPVSPTELINAPIQADEAIIVCDAMCRLSEMEVWDLQPNLEIHDDLTFIWHKNDVEKYAEVVIKTMLDCPYEWAHVVPLGVEMSIGLNWAEQKKVGEFFSDQDRIVIEAKKII